MKKLTLLFIVLFSLALVSVQAQEPEQPDAFIEQLVAEPQHDDSSYWVKGSVAEFIAAVNLVGYNVTIRMDDPTYTYSTSTLFVANKDFTESYSLEAFWTGSESSTVDGETVYVNLFVIRRAQWEAMIHSLTDPMPTTELRLSDDGTALEVWVGEEYIGRVAVDSSERISVDNP